MKLFDCGHPLAPWWVYAAPEVVASLSAGGRTINNNQNNHQVNHLLDRGWENRTFLGMRTQEPKTFKSIVVPAKYRLHFTDAEFKFRWIDALKVELDSWRTSTDLFVAMMLSSYMNESGECHPGIPTLARAMKMSQETVRRSLRRLEENGWLFIRERVADTNKYVAVLPVYGLDLLLESRNKNTGGESAEVWQDALDSVLRPVSGALGVSVEEWSVVREWARLEGRLRQVIQRMGGPTSDLSSLNKHLLDELPEHVHSPTAYLLHRLALFTRLHPHLSGRKRSRQTSTSQSHVAVLDVVRATAKQLASINGKGAGPREPAPSS